MRTGLWIGLAWVASGFSSSCDGPREREARHVILVTLDTTRRDALEPWGGIAELTPTLASLAKEGLVCDEARTVAPLTLPAHASMLTGLVPPRHGLRDNGLAPLAQEAESAAEIAQRAGISTGAFVSAAVLDGFFGLDQGFDVYDDVARPEQVTSSHYVERTALETLARAEAWLTARTPDERLFLWLHLFDPHVPYQPPPRELALAGNRPYLGEIALVDRALGRLIEVLRQRELLDDSLLIVVADHGESLGEHGEPTHGAFCYDATIRVPLLLCFPGGRRAGERTSAPISVVDLAPTLLEALGLWVPPDLDGQSLWRGDPEPERGTYCESYAGYLNYGWSPLAGWTQGKSKALFSSAPEVYDLSHDPLEQVDLADERGADLGRGRRALFELYSRPVLPMAPIVDAARFADDLRRLGYAWSGEIPDALPTPFDTPELASPRRQAHELAPLLEASGLIDARQWPAAIERLEALVEQNPRHKLARDLFAFALLQIGEFARSEGLLTARLAEGPPRADLHINLSSCLEARADREGALRELCRASDLDPENRQAWEGIARLAELLGRDAQARDAQRVLDSLRSR